jgi:DNA-directed RNA polymerase subunit alpha
MLPRIHIPKDIKIISKTERSAQVLIEGLYPGYGITVGNAMRRVLFSSMPGAAITSFRISGVPHEFSTIPGVLEDVVDISLNLKQIRLKVFSDEPVELNLVAKGEREIKAGDISPNSLVEIVNPDAHIATLTDKKASIEMTLRAEKGIGYLPVELRKKEKLPIGEIAIDAIFTPITKVNYQVENMRVGDRTDYNSLKIFVETDGTIDPIEAIKEASSILMEHFSLFDKLSVEEKSISEQDKKKKQK